MQTNIEDEADRLIRHLRRSPFNEVFSTMPHKRREVAQHLERHGWTEKELLEEIWDVHYGASFKFPFAINTLAEQEEDDSSNSKDTL
jgi:hypothetical protein